MQFFFYVNYDINPPPYHQFMLVKLFQSDSKQKMNKIIMKSMYCGNLKWETSKIGKQI